MLITIGAIFLLSSIILTVNRGLLNTNSVMMDNRYGIMAVSLATSIIETATNKAFDEQSDTLGLSSTNSLTLSNALGLDAGESRDSVGKFDDFDDYNCFKSIPKVDSLPLLGTDSLIYFNTYCEVKYVSSDDPQVVSVNRTWNKRIDVKVTSPGLSDTVRMSTVYSYFFFR